MLMLTTNKTNTTLSSPEVDPPHPTNAAEAANTALLSIDSEERLDAPPVPWMHGAAGILGGSISMTLFYPLDFLRTRMHTYDDSKKHKPIDDFRSVLRQEGVRGMYKGVKVAVAAHSIGWGLYLTFFRFAQQNIAAFRGHSSTLGDFLGACCAAVTTATLVTPLNLVKTRTQLAKGVIPESERGFRRTIVHITRTEGWGALFRGVGPQILLSSHTTIQVALYECLKRWMWGDGGDAPMMGIALVSGFSKAVAASACNPLEVVRTRLQDKKNREKVEYQSMTNAFKHIWKHEGVQGMYRGIGVNVCRVVPTTICAFVLYEQCLKVIKMMHGNRQHQAAAAARREQQTAK
jgi:solute carrier family 25 (mitochondrial folate transporter), member 32